MNKEFTRMQKLAGILTEGYQGSDYGSSEDMALDMVKTGAGLAGNLPEGTSRMTKRQLKEKIKEMMLSEDAYSAFPDDIDWEVVGRDMDGLSLEGYSETTNKYYTGAVEGSYDPDTDPEPKFSNDELLFIEEIPPHHLSPIQKHLLSKDSMDEDLFEAKKDEKSDTEDVIVADTEGEVPAEGGEDVAVDDTQVDVDMDGVPDVDTGSAESKKAFTSLVDTYNAAKELGDPKLTQMIANALTYYNKNIILKAGQPQA